MACLSAVIVLLTKDTLDQATTRRLAELSQASCLLNTTQSHWRACCLLHVLSPECLGIGSGMLALLLRRAFDEGARDAWLLATTAAPFVERGGFKRAERSAAPATILATRQAASLCPSTAALLTRGITL